MTIILNGSPHELPAPVTLADLLASLGLTGRPVVVELNETAVLPRAYSTSMVTDGARVEVVTLAAGG